MAYFYGWSLEYIEAMETPKFYQCFKAITAIEAARALVDMKITMLPKTKKEDRDRFHKDMYKLSQTKEEVAERAMTAVDMEKIHGDFGSIEAIIREKNKKK